MADRYPHEIATDPSGPHHLILAHCRNAELVLDIGCWSGALGRLMLASGVGAVDGIEIDPEAAERAAAYYRHVWIADIESFDIPDDCRYDRIVLADVLEHTRDPIRVLKRLADHLRSGGMLILSLPNVAHLSMRVKLLLGRWDYTDTGLLDRTHFHLFTLASARRELEQAGFHVKAMSYVPGTPVARWLTTIWPAGLAWQFVIAAQP